MTRIGLSPADRAVRLAIYRSFADQGRPASVGQIAAETGLAEAGVGCAWDSFGISAALGEPVVIRTRCPGCGRDLVLRAGPDQPPAQGPVVHIPCQASRWWDDVVAVCSNIRLFCEPAHVDAWARPGSHTVGQVIPSVTMWRLAQTWYGNRLDPDWSPRPTAAAQQLLEQCGLVGGFWRLPG